jgi:hypothetical protein
MRTRFTDYPATRSFALSEEGRLAMGLLPLRLRNIGPLHRTCSLSKIIFVGHGFKGYGKSFKTFCHSERSEESLFLFIGLTPREILRFAQNDKINYYFRGLFSRGIRRPENQGPYPLMADRLRQ